jgi:predicted NACHT family NTPase
MRVLDMPHPIQLTGENGIYTNVKILQKLTRLKTKRELEDNGFSSSLSERLPGLDAVKKNTRLMVLGKPGAGKTTFLKYLAMQCITGQFAEDKVPFFVTLKDFAEAQGSPDLVEYLAKSVLNTKTQPFYGNFSGKTPAEVVRLLLQKGRVFILFDGLDEVCKKDAERISQEIRTSANFFGKSLFVITCRIAAREDVFMQFTDVEVADFDDLQIATFVEYWFRAKNDSQKAKSFNQKLLLPKNERIRELASNPLLLTLLCLGLGEIGDFPQRRADLYKDGVRILLQKWDAAKGTERDEVYRNLDVKLKRDLLSFVAFQTFSRGELFLEQERIEEYIASFIRNLSDVDPNPEMLRLDSEAVLRSIQSQHGLLVEQARGVYSFSHLTLQEYFTAREINLTNHPTKWRELVETLKQNFPNPQWREVILLTMEMSRDASYLLREIKTEIDSKLANNQPLQDFLQWVQEKSDHISTSYQPFIVRAFYYSLPLGFGDEITLKLDPAFDRAACHDLQLDNKLSVLLSGATAKAHIPLDYALRVVLELLSEGDELKNQLQGLYNRLPKDKRSETLRLWKETYGLQWVQDLRTIMTTKRNIGQDRGFTSEQKQLLQQYYKSNLFLWDCLHTASFVDLDTREHIKETFLRIVK